MQTVETLVIWANNETCLYVVGFAEPSRLLSIGSSRLLFCLFTLKEWGQSTLRKNIF